MVFKQIGTEVSFLSKSFKDIKKDFSSGLGIKQSLFSFISQNDIKALNDFEKAIRNSSMAYKQAFDTYLSKAPIAIKRQANEIIKLTNQQRVLNAQRQAGKTTEEQYNTAMTANKAKMQALTTQTQSLTLSQKAATVASKGLSIAMNLLGNIAIMGIITLISKGVKYLSDLANHVEITREKVNELTSTFKSALGEANSNAKRVEELADRYDELSDGVNNLGENVSLTNEEYEEYNTLVNEIADMFPTLVQGYTDEGNAILNLKGNVEALRNAYKEAQQEAYNLLIVNGQDSDGNDILQQWKDLYDTGFWASAFDLGVDDVGKGISASDALEQLKAIQNLTAEEYREIKRIVDSGGSEELSQLSDIELEIGNSSYLKGALGLTWDISDEDFAEAKKQASALVQTYNAQIESALSDVKTLAKAYLMTNEDYDKLDEQSKNVASIIVNSLDADIASGFKDKTDVSKYVQNIIDTINNNPEVNDAMNKLFTMDTSSMSVREIKSNIDKYISIIAKTISEDEDKLKIRFGFDDIGDELDRAYEKFGLKTDGSSRQSTIDKRNFLAGLNIEDLEIATQIPDLFADGLDGATAKIEAWKADPKNKIAPDVDTSELNTIIETTSKKVKLITTAMEEMNDTGSISSSTYGEIVEMGGNFVDCLEVQNGKLKLNVQKLKDLEKQENLNAIAAKNLAISELQAAAAMAAQSHDADKVEEIRKQITALEKEKAVLWQINDEIANTKPEKSGGSGEEETPTEIQNFLDDYAKYHHDINMGIKKEDEDYFNWLEKAAHDAYSKYPDYEDDLWKYEEEVYKGRKQLAEDYFDEQQKLFEDRVSNLETQIEITAKTSESSDGTKLNTKEKYDDIRNGYQEIINIIEERINEIVQAGVEGHEDLLAELEKQIEEYQEKLSDVFKSAVEEEQDYIEKQKDAFSDAYDERIDKIKEEKEAAEEAAQAEIDAIQEKIDALEKANEKAEEANNIEKARQELEKAKNQRTVATVSANGTISYQADPEAVQKAQEELDNALFEQQINLLEDQKDLLEKSKDKQSEAYDDIIENLTSQKEEGERQFDILLKVLDDYLNPDKSTSNIDVWSILAKTEGIKLGKNGQWVDKDGKVIDIEKLMKSSQTETDAEKNVGNNSSDNKNNTNGTKLGRIEKKQLGSENETELNTESKTESALDKLFANWEKMFDLEKGSLTIEKVQQVLINSPTMKYNPYGAMSERMNKVYRNEYVSNVNNNNSSPINVTMGDTIIQNPVTNSYDLAEDIVKNLPNAVAKQIHKKNQ